MSDKLTIKQKKFVKEYIQTGNATEAASRVYDCKDRDSANAIGGENLVKLSKTINEICEEVGLTDDFILKCLTEDITLKPQNRKAELELAMKVKGKLTDKQEIKADVQYSTKDMSEEELDHIIETYKGISS